MESKQLELFTMPEPTEYKPNVPQPGSPPLFLAQRLPSQKDFGISSQQRHLSTELLVNLLPELTDFMPDRLSLKTLHKMRRDPMIRLGLHFIKMPLMNASWRIEGPNDQQAKFIEWALDRVWPKLLSNLLLSLEFGYSVILKKWIYEAPPQELGLWSGPAGVLPVVPDDVFALPPELTSPRFTKRGKFNGIYFRPHHAAQTEIPDEYILWHVNEAESMFGNFYGYPRIGLAYTYWRSYWFRWLLYDRHFEMDADPPLVVWGPSGSYTDEHGKPRRWKDDGLAIGEYLRSGSTVYMPSEPYVDEQTGRPAQSRQWDMEFKYGGHNNDMFTSSFEYLDVAKLRALLVPEQAIIEGAKGSGSRNVAATYGTLFAESQYVLMKQLDEQVNRYFVDKIAEYNFGVPKGTYKKVTNDFHREDQDLMGKLMMELAKTGPEEMLEARINIQELARKLQLPTLSEDEYNSEKQRREKEAEARFERAQRAFERQAQFSDSQEEETNEVE